MKRILITLLGLSCLVQAESTTIDLTPKSIATSLVSKGINSEDVWNYTLNEWHGTWENTDLKDQVGVGDSALNLQIGATASNNTGGNFAAVKFETETAPLTLSFDVKGVKSWGGNLGSFKAEYVCTVYGYTEEGSATAIGSWSSGTINGNDGITFTANASITLNEGYFSSYGVIFNSIDRSSLGRAAGFSFNITNITVTTAPIPEPATATLSLLALAGLAARRRRK